MLSVTEKAKVKVHEFLTQEDNQGKALRVYVEGGGCAGFQYGLAFDEKRDDDEVVVEDGFEVVIDPMSQTYLEDCTVDYLDGLYGAGFKVNNPKAAGTCGCGSSFTL